MRLPWQKDKAPDVFSTSFSNSNPSSPEAQKKAKKKTADTSNLKSLMSSKNNQSTGSYVIYDDNALGKDSEDTLKTSDEKIKKEKKKKKHHHHHHHHKSDSSDEIKDKESPGGSSEEIIPNTFKNLRKSSPSGSPLASSEDIFASGSSKNPKDSLEHVMERDGATKSLSVPTAGPNMGRRKSVDASMIGSASPAAAHEKERKKKKDKHGKKAVSFNEFDIQLLPEGAMVVRDLKPEPKTDEVPYHKRGKQEYKEKKERKKEKLKEKLLRMEAGDHVDLESDSDVDGVLVPALNILTASEEALNAKPKEVNHIIKFTGQLPQVSKITDKASVILHSVQVAKYTPEVKGCIIIKGKDELLIPGRDDGKELKVRVRFLFDDWDSRTEIKATAIEPNVLKTVLKRTPPTSPYSSKDMDSSQEFDNNLLGYSFSIPIHKTFLPCLYKMLHQMGMNTTDATFQVDGVIVFGISVYKGEPPPPPGPLDLPPPPDITLRELREREKLLKEREYMLELSDQIILSTKYELSFAVEKNPANMIHEQDLLHPAYKPAAIVAAEQQKLSEEWAQRVFG